jgi:hypothetical protein
MIGLDNLGGSSANRVTDAQADILGGVGGPEIRSIAQMPAHTHSASSMANASPGSAVFSTSGAGGVQLNTNSTGGGSPFNPPFVALRCVIGT